MKLKPKNLAMALASAVMLTLAGCGGGDSTTSTTLPAAVTPTTITPAVVTPTTISGVAATGAAFTDAVITVIDSTGAVVGTSSPVGADGTYSVTIGDGAKAPFVLVASRTTADGQVQTLVSVVESAMATMATTATTANVTPITNLIASLLSASGDPAKLASELAAGTVQITADAVAATVAEVKTILAPLLAATGTSSTDPLTGTFTVDGTGYDRLLDSLSISIIPASATSSNIEIAVKQQLPDGTQPATTSFTSDSTTMAPLPTVDATTLVEEGTSVKIANFLTELTTCYGVPFADRVNGVTGTVTAVVGTAADVKTPQCRSVFSGGDPANFLSSGNKVGRDANNNGAFAGLFRAGATGVVFSQGTYEFTRGNGDLVIGYKSKDTSNNEVFDTFVVRKDTADGKLKLIGNLYKFPGGVSAYQQYRQFITLGQSAYNYHSTGYSFNVANKVDGLGNSIFARVVVTSPSGSTLTLKPSSGSSVLNLVKGPLQSDITGTSFLRLRSVYADSTTPISPAPSEIDPSLFFSSVPRTDAEIAAIPGQSVWSFQYYFTSTYLTANPSVTDGLTQTYKTRARALTIAELKQQGLAQLSPAVIADIQTDPNLLNGQPLLPENEAVGPIDFTVPTGALPVTQIKIFGRVNPFTTPQGARFDDAVAVRSTERAGTVACTKASGTDAHCSTSVQGAYAPNAYANGLHLWSRDGAGREYANFYAMYKLTLPAP